MFEDDRLVIQMFHTYHLLTFDVAITNNMIKGSNENGNSQSNFNKMAYESPQKHYKQILTPAQADQINEWSKIGYLSLRNSVSLKGLKFYICIVNSSKDIRSYVSRWITENSGTIKVNIENNGNAKELFLSLFHDIFYVFVQLHLCQILILNRLHNYQRHDNWRFWGRHNSRTKPP